jgi:SulP family sulfate permease
MPFKELVASMKGYTRQAFASDLTAGLIVGIVALPLCIAFAIASGLEPDKGIITGVVASFFIALFSGSRTQIGGPSGPFVVIAFGVIQQAGLNGLIIATFAAGVMLIIMGKTGLGSLIKFIPYPVIAGFQAGVAVMLLTTEFKDLLGLSVMEAGGNVVAKWQSYMMAIGTVNPYALAVSAGSILFMMLPIKGLRRIPNSLIALIGATIIVQVFQLPVDTIGTRFKEIASGLPKPLFPDISFEVVREMIQPAVAIALLAAIEGLLSAVVADGITGQTHEPNKVLIAAGIANLGTSIFGGLPATAAIARTATNARNGGRTFVGGVTHAVLLLLIMLFLGRWAALIPLASLGAILFVVAYNLLDWRALSQLMKNPKSDVAVLLATLGLTVFVDLSTGILIGMAMAAALFIKRMAAVTDVNVVTREFHREAQGKSAFVSIAPIPRGVEIYEINGPFFFGAVYKLREALRVVVTKPKVRMIRMSQVNAMDSTGLHALEEVYKMCKKEKSTFLISEIHAQPFTALLKSGLLETFGEENVLASYEEALARAEQLIQPKAPTQS